MVVRRCAFAALASGRLRRGNDRLADAKGIGPFSLTNMAVKRGKAVAPHRATGYVASYHHGRPSGPNNKAPRPMLDYEKIRHAVKTGDKIMELAASLGLEPERHTIKDLADRLLQDALGTDGGVDDAPIEHS